MASNAMSRTENQARTCLVQILFFHTFLPDHFVQRSIKLLSGLLFFLKNERSVQAISSDSALVS